MEGLGAGELSATGTLELEGVSTTGTLELEGCSGEASLEGRGVAELPVP